MKRLILPCLVLVACSKNGTQTASSKDAEDAATKHSSRETGFSSSEGRHTGRVGNPSSEVELAVVVDMPRGEGPWPVLVVSPGGTMSGERGLPSFQRVEWTEAGFAVVTWDPDGRGESAGTEDHGGHIHQDGLKAVIDIVSTLPKMDSDRMGLVSLSYGVVMSTGMLTRHETPIRFLVDWEGPANRWDMRDCDPNADSRGGPPRASSDLDCVDESYWVEREAERFVSQLQVPYHRVQTNQDHAQPDTEHNTRMIEAAIGGGVAEVWLNDNRIYTDSDSLQLIDKGPRNDAVLKYAIQQMESTTGEPVTSAQAPEHLTSGSDAASPGKSKRPGRKGKKR